jgi:nucleotide-binding universal stress UspA family protein
MIVRVRIRNSIDGGQAVYTRILVALDDSEPAAQALDEAVRLATALHAQLRLFHVVDNRLLWRGGENPVDPESIDEEWAARGRRILAQGEATANAAGVAVETGLGETDGRGIDAAIAAEAARWPAELIVVGAHGQQGLVQLVLGSVAEGVIRHASVPVLVVHGRKADAPAGGRP